MFGKRPLLPLFIVLAFVLSACGAQNTAGGGTKFNGTIHIDSSTWTGYALIYLANSKGIWKQHGLDVNFKDVEDPNDRFIALAAGPSKAWHQRLTRSPASNRTVWPLWRCFPSTRR